MPNNPPRSGGDKGSTDTINSFKKSSSNQKSFVHDEVLRIAEDLGKSLSQSGSTKGGVETTRTQVRKFYNLIKVAQVRASSSEPSVEQQLKVKLRILQAQVTYAVGRETINKDFKDLFDHSIDLILNNDVKKLLTEFATFFEALYAYFYYYSKKDREPSR